MLEDAATGRITSLRYVHEEPVIYTYERGRLIVLMRRGTMSRTVSQNCPKKERGAWSRLSAARCCDSRVEWAMWARYEAVLGGGIVRVTQVGWVVAYESVDNHHVARLQASRSRPGESRSWVSGRGAPRACRRVAQGGKMVGRDNAVADEQVVGNAG